MTTTPGSLSEAWWSALAANQSRTSLQEVKVNVNRARALVRGGKVIGLQLTPGLVTADVVDGQTYAVSVLPTTFGAREWDKVTAVLAADLGSVTALFEGALPAAFVARLGEAGVRLVPAKEDIEGSCDCADHVYPCAHLAAVQLLVGQVIDADPLELFTLRGRSRDALLSSLRRAWGGEEGRSERHAEPARFDDDPYASPAPLHGLRFEFHITDEAPGAGLRALGPIAGDADLLKALAPIYEAGGRAALGIALGDSTVAPLASASVPNLVAEPPRPRAPWPPTPPPTPPPRVQREPTPEPDVATEGDERPLTERIVEALAVAEGGGMLVGELVKHTRGSPPLVRRELAELEVLGLVYRAGSSGASRWHLG